MIQHSRRKTGFLAGIWLTGLITLVTLVAQTPVQIHPTAPPDVNRAITIAVLADGFTASAEDQADFNDAAANFFTYGLLVDADFEPHKDLIAVKTIFKPVATASASQFGFVLGAGYSNCSIHWDESPGPTGTAALIEAAAAPVNPTHVVVIGNHNYNFGCSDDTWTYVAVGAVGEQIIHHELGHLLGGLKDEYAIPELAKIRYPDPFDEVNCSTAPFATPPTAPHWVTSGLLAAPAGGFPEGCALYGKGIVRPTDDCRMGVHGTAFCKVCSTEMQKTWDYYSNPEGWNPNLSARAIPANLRISTAGFSLQPSPPQSAQLPQGSQLRLLTNVNRVTGAVTVQTATDVTGALVPRRRRVGVYVSEVMEGNNEIAFDVISGDPFSSHGYRGGGSQHTRVPGEPPTPSETASIVVSIPGVSRADLISGKRAVGLTFYQLGPTVKDPIIRQDAWAKYRTGNQVKRIASVTPDKLKELVEKPGTSSVVGSSVRQPEPKKEPPVPRKPGEKPPVKK
jgi:hypothetical protein